MGLWRTLLILLYVGLCGIALAGLRDDPSPKTEITYNKDVAPILNRHCVACHRPNDIAPMSLMTYKDTRSWARPIRDARLVLFSRHAPIVPAPGRRQMIEALLPEIAMPSR